MVRMPNLKKFHNYLQKSICIPLLSVLVSYVGPHRQCDTVVVPLMSYLVHTAADSSPIPMASPMCLCRPLQQSSFHCHKTFHGMGFITFPLFSTFASCPWQQKQKVQVPLVNASFAHQLFICSSLPKFKLGEMVGIRQTKRASLYLIQPFFKVLSSSQISYC